MVMNKKASIGGWTETIILSMLFVALLGMVVGYMNTTYGGSNEIGLDTSAIDANGTFAQYTITAQGQIEGGETEQTDTGLSLTNSWSIAKGIFTIVWGVLSGAWIANLGAMMMLPIVVSNVLRILFIASLIFAVIRLFFKVGL